MKGLFLSPFFFLACSAADASPRIEITDPPYDSLSDDGTSWQSSPWYDQTAPAAWIEYPAEASVVIHHTLGRIPHEVAPYISFEQNGQSAGIAAGDLAHIVSVTATTVELKNTTRSDYFLRVVLH